MPRCCIVTASDGTTLARTEVTGSDDRARAAARAAADHAADAIGHTGTRTYDERELDEVSAD